VTAGTVGLHTLCANAVLNAFRHVSHDVTTVYVQLHTGLPGADGEDNISVADPSLKLVSFGAAVHGSIDISASPVWTNDDHTETLTHITTWDGSVGAGTDDCLWAAQLTTSQNWSDGDTYTLDNCSLTLTPLMTDEGS
jgi:hypothetical protein